MVYIVQPGSLEFANVSHKQVAELNSINREAISYSFDIMHIHFQDFKMAFIANSLNPFWSYMAHIAIFAAGIA